MRARWLYVPQGLALIIEGVILSVGLLCGCDDKILMRPLTISTLIPEGDRDAGSSYR